jgi:integrase
MKNHAYPTLGEMQVRTITAADVFKVLKPIWTSSADTASKLRGQIEKVLGWCRTWEYIKGPNVAVWKDNLQNMLPPSPRKKQKQHHPSLPWQQIGEFVEALHNQKGVGALSLEFMILTATRTSEVTGAVWAEFQLDQSLWVIPKERMKAGKEHVVVLSPRAVEIIKEMEKTKVSKFVFPGLKAGKPQSNAAMAKLVKRMHEKKVLDDAIGWVDPKGEEVVPHGFRATFRTWGGDRANFGKDVLEHALAHQLENEVEGAYNRGTMIEKRIPLMNAWAEYCSRPAGDEADVIPLRSAL